MFNVKLELTSQSALITCQVPVWLCGACEEKQASGNMMSAQCWLSLRRRGFPAAPERQKHSSNERLTHTKGCVDGSFIVLKN